MVVKFLAQLYNILKMVCEFFQGLIHTVACMRSIRPGGRVEGGAPKSEIWKKWFGLRGCRSIKIIYRKDYVQSFTVIQDELSEKWHFEVGRGKCVRLWRWQGHVKYTITDYWPAVNNGGKELVSPRNNSIGANTAWDDQFSHLTDVTHHFRVLRLSDSTSSHIPVINWLLTGS